MKLTLKGGHNILIPVWNSAKEPQWLRLEYSLVTEAADQNRLRYKLGILARMGLGQIWHDIKVVWHDDKKMYRVWVYTRNWEGRASYYGGMIYAYERTHKKNAARKRQTA